MQVRSLEVGFGSESFETPTNGEIAKLVLGYVGMWGIDREHGDKGWGMESIVAFVK
jgi:hypothetical protein